ncbi:MAG: pyridoxal 5'-phosphate synthase glutaminase subunit PdxT [Candidatus Nanopelagicales bacterium]|nr:pyridoxal 5'-phosphate synthase glutaminase subunit PdxT [Candidatus Nanopelagicales bacterium]
MTATIGVLALQGDVREHARLLRELGVTVRPIRRADQLAGVQGLVIPGGESTTISRLAIDFGLLEPLREAVRDGLPVLGTCAGMIMLAKSILDGRPDQETIGGLDILVRRNAFGRQVESFETGVKIAGMSGPDFPGVFIRAPWVESAGPRVTVLARLVPSGGPGSGPGEGRIVAVRQDRILAAAFHPELSADPSFHSMFLSMIE